MAGSNLNEQPLRELHTLVLCTKRRELDVRTRAERIRGLVIEQEGAGYAERAFALARNSSTSESVAGPANMELPTWT